MSASNIAAIDVHGHYGCMDRGPSAKLWNEFMSGDSEEVVRRARDVNVRWTIVSPLTAFMPRGHGDTYAGNIEAAKIVERMPELLQYVVIDPRDDRTFLQASEMLQRARCVGIKIHPEEHIYPISEFGHRIFEFAAQRKAIILTHSSEQNSLASDFVPLADDFPEVQLILAHLGCGWDGDATHQVRAIERCRNRNMFVDTSSGSSLKPGLIEWAVREIGADRVLFGTDTPLYFTAMQRSRIDYAELSEQEKQLILRDNADMLFNLNGEIFRD